MHQSIPGTLIFTNLKFDQTSLLDRHRNAGQELQSAQLGRKSAVGWWVGHNIGQAHRITEAEVCVQRTGDHVARAHAEVPTEVEAVDAFRDVRILGLIAADSGRCARADQPANERSGHDIRSERLEAILSFRHQRKLEVIASFFSRGVALGDSETALNVVQLRAEVNVLGEAVFVRHAECSASASVGVWAFGVRAQACSADAWSKLKTDKIVSACSGRIALVMFRGHALTTVSLNRISVIVRESDRTHHAKQNYTQKFHNNSCFIIERPLFTGCAYNAMNN
jgi:hypothetical protein